MLATVRGTTNVNFTDYDGAGQLRARATVAPSGFGAESRSYDSVGRLNSIDGPTQQLSVSYHPDGQIKTVQRGTSRKTTYGYDDAGRLTSGVTDYLGDVDGSVAYTWDADGNRTGVSTNGQPQVTADFDLADRLTSTSDGTAFGYDDDGLLRTAGATTYGYNGFGEQASVATSSTSVSYLRDGLGRMSARTAGGATTSFGYDATSGDLAAAQTGTGPLTSMIRTPDGQLLAEATAGTTTQQAWTNVHGDVVARKDDTGSTVRWTADYDPFGKVTASTGTAAVPLGFQSRSPTPPPDSSTWAPAHTTQAPAGSPPATPSSARSPRRSHCTATCTPTPTRSTTPTPTGTGRNGLTTPPPPSPRPSTPSSTAPPTS